MSASSSSLVCKQGRLQKVGALVSSSPQGSGGSDGLMKEGNIYRRQFF